MKKYLLSLITSIIITLIGLLINYFSYRNDGKLLLAIKMYGGEIKLEYGFGLRLRTIYTMSSEGVNRTSLHFSIINFVFTVFVLSLIIFVVIKVFKIACLEYKGKD